MPRLLSHWSRCQDHAARTRRRRHIDGLDVLFVGAHIADMREREGDDLPRIGRIGEDLLVAGHGGVEADFADRLSDRSEAETFEHRAVGEHEQGGGLRFGPAGIVLFAGHQRTT